MTEVVNLLTVGRDNCDVYIGRAGGGEDGYFGNPFMLLGPEKSDRIRCIENFRNYFIDRIGKDAEFKRRVEGLRGKRLGCFCAPAPCHGNIYITYLEGWDMSDNLLDSMSEETPELKCRDCGTTEDVTVRGGDLADDERLCVNCFDKIYAAEMRGDMPDDEIEELYDIGDGRLPMDAYYTPEVFTQELVRRIPQIVGVCFEPCAGDGAISHVLEQYVCPEGEVWTNDFDPKLKDMHDYHMDAVSPEVFELVNPDWVITNPPYKSDILPEIVKNGLQFAYQGMAMLLRLSFLEPTIERDGWLCENPPDLLIVTPRFSFKRNGKTDSVTTAWFVWYNQPRPPYGDWRTDGMIPEWPKGIQIMHRSVLDGVK